MVLQGVHLFTVIRRQGSRNSCWWLLVCRALCVLLLPRRPPTETRPSGSSLRPRGDCRFEQCFAAVNVWFLKKSELGFEGWDSGDTPWRKRVVFVAVVVCHKSVTFPCDQTRVRWPQTEQRVQPPPPQTPPHRHQTPIAFRNTTP